jgi:hypothetical protein
MVQMSTQFFLNGITLDELANALKPLLQPQQSNNEILQTEPEFLTREQVCKLLSFNKTSLWKHTKTGKLKSYGIGNRVLYKRTEVLEAVTPLNV